MARALKTSFTAVDALLAQSEEVNAASLDRFARDHAADERLLLYLIQLAESGDERAQIAATALLKRYQRGGVGFGSAVVTRLVDLIEAQQHWEATLHLLQILPGLSVPNSCADSLCDSLRKLTGHPNAFVRAWSYGGLHRLAELHPQYRADLAPLLERARRKETPSVRARLRQLRPL